MEVLDLRGLKCPLPALLARRALKRTPAGGKLAVISDDPLAEIDIPYMCDSEGHEVAEVERLEIGVRLVLHCRNNRPIAPVR